MIKVTLLELIFRGIPEGICFIWAVHVFSRTPVKYKNLLLTAFIATMTTYLVRFLPLNLGLNTFLSIPVMIYINVFINKIPVKKAVSATILIFIIGTVSELIDVGLLQVLNVDVNRIFTNPHLRIIYGLPSLLLEYLVVIVASAVMKNKSVAVERNF